MIYWAKTMGNIRQKLWELPQGENCDLMSKSMGYFMGYIGQNYWIY